MDSLYLEYQKVVNFHLSTLAKNSCYILSQPEIKSLNSRLSYRYKQCAARQAIKIWKIWRKNWKKNSQKPEFNGTLILDSRFINMKKTEHSSFDFWVKIATLNKRHPILIPIKSYSYANEYFKKWELVNGGQIQKQGNQWFLLLSFKKQAPKMKETGDTIGIDVGIKKLIVTSEEKFYGMEIESLMEKIQRKQQKSKAFNRALKERNYYINKIVKELPFRNLKAIVVEDLKGLKNGTKKRLRKSFRNKFQRWTYPRILNRIHQFCELNGVHFHRIDPAYTSQTCSNCKSVHKLSRNRELFKCRHCGYTTDADYNASLNILNSWSTQQNMVAESMKTDLLGISIY